MTPEERAEHVLGKIANDLKWTMPPPLYREWIADAIRVTMLEAAEAGAKAMQEWLAEGVPYLIEGDVAQAILRGAIQSVNPATVARRAVEQEKP